MNFKPLTLSFARCLHRLANGEQLNASEISSKTVLKRFIDDGIIQSRATGNRRHIYICNNSQALHNYLQIQEDILSLESYILQKQGNGSDGEQSLQATKSTKTFREQSLQGFFIKAYGTNIHISGNQIPTMPDGIELFIHEPKKLQISPKALIIGIENPECFIKFKQLLNLFPQKEIIVVMRYMSLSSNKWLQSIPNSYLHFGDFDPAGISIYIHEFREKLQPLRCNFFVPADIENMIVQYGTTTLYDKQINQLKNINTEDYPEIESLIKILHKHGKGMEQERLIGL